ncbi:hypothetical protein EBI_27230 [Enterocytozoon bieneusi H348]|nr:hypothetical protein EBI_27230 [Enterocytozoon bieneusi H348]|eukprot:XP_002651080.1 hypothetical protein EBI_27230 [Enterocytozoon bieneusi H348]
MGGAPPPKFPSPRGEKHFFLISKKKPTLFLKKKFFLGGKKIFFLNPPLNPFLF